MMCRDKCHCTLVLKNDLDEIDSVWAAILDVLENFGLDRRDLFQINLVVDELFTNIVSYAYPDKGEHDIEANISIEKKHLVVEFVDDGIEFNPVEFKEPDICESLQKRHEGGLGIHFCRKCNTNCTHERKNGQNHVTCIKRIHKTRSFDKLITYQIINVH